MSQFNPASIKETIIPPNVGDDSTFLYEYTNLKNDMKYVGKRKGKPLEGYYHSSESKKFLSDFTDSNAKFKFEDLDVGELFWQTNKPSETNPWRKENQTQGKNLKAETLHNFQPRTKVFQKI